MDTHSLITSLVSTYRELNTKYRPYVESDAAMQIVLRMRDDEIQFSKALKDRLTGIGTADLGSGNSEDVVEGSADNFAQVISQFGSARATTLNLLKGIQDDSAWQTNLDDGSTILQHVDELVRSDAAQLQRLAETTGI